MPEVKEFRLKVSETGIVKKSAFSSSISIVYAGMLNDTTFSVAVIWSRGHNSMAYNLYLSKYDREFFLHKGRVEILEVYKDEIRLKYHEVK
ncbi:hypothetical protein ACFLS9_00930 [Bacteroidota bacterium]